MLMRASRAKYTAGSLRFLPKNYLNQAFIQAGDEFRLKGEFQENISLIQQDIREETPPGDYDLILCRNLVFTYFRENLQTELLHRITGKLRNRGYLVIGIHEKLPMFPAELQATPDYATIFQKLSSKD
jgi:chemotaxis protein methyltransferase CheR